MENKPTEYLPSPEQSFKQIVDTWALSGVSIELDEHGATVLYGPKPVAEKFAKSHEARYLWSHRKLLVKHIKVQLVTRIKNNEPDPIWY